MWMEHKKHKYIKIAYNTSRLSLTLHEGGMGLVDSEHV